MLQLIRHVTHHKEVLIGHRHMQQMTAEQLLADMTFLLVQKHLGTRRFLQGDHAFVMYQVVSLI